MHDGEVHSVSREPWQHYIRLRAESCEAIQYYLWYILPMVDLQACPLVLWVVRAGYNFPSVDP